MAERVRATPTVGAAPRRLAASSVVDVLIVLGMAFGLLVFYRASFQVPLTALGLGIFVACALLRPQWALLWMPLTAPLYLMPKGIWDERWGIRPEGLRLPLHEVVLLVVALATSLHVLLHVLRAWRAGVLSARLGALRAWLRRERVVLALAALFLVAGTLGVVLALPIGRSEALRQWRWLIVEPLIVYGLVCYWLAHAPEAQRYSYALATAVVLAGSAVAVVGLLQYVGYDLVPLIGQRVAHIDSVIVVEGVRRVTSVYGHPNNLALWLGRAWPLAFCVTLWAWQARGTSPKARERASREPSMLLRGAILYGLATLLMLAMLLLNASRGANLGALAAGLVLAWGLLRAASGGWRRWAIGAALALLALLVVGTFRDDGGSVGARLLLWQAALAMLRDHPLGVGLGGFFFYHNPDFGHGYIAPELVGSSEQYAAHPHNLLLDVALHTGPLGVLVFAGLLAVVLRRALHAQHAAVPIRLLALGVLASLAAALVHGAVDNFYFVPDLAIFFWLVVALSSTFTPVPTRGE